MLWESRAGFWRGLAPPGGVALTPHENQTKTKIDATSAFLDPFLNLEYKINLHAVRL